MIRSLVLGLLVLMGCGLASQGWAQTNEDMRVSRPLGTDRSLYPETASTSSQNTASGTTRPPGVYTPVQVPSGSTPNSNVPVPTGASTTATPVNLNAGPQVKPRAPILPNTPIKTRVPIKPRP